MVRPLTEILWQLERKRKCLWPCGTNRIQFMAKGVTLLILLILFYSVFSIALQSESTFEFLSYNASALESGAERRQQITGNSIAFASGQSLEDASAANTSEQFSEGVVSKLTRQFNKYDVDKDGSITLEELTKGINKAVIAHFAKALRDNFDHYFQLDINPRNGLVSWEEYVDFFFRIRGIPDVTAGDILNRTKIYNNLPHEIKVELARIQASWSESALNNPDFLTVDEFLSFEHPEASATRILAHVQDTLDTFDLDGDGTISKTEFETTYKEAEGVDPVYKRDKALIDSDGNGEISRLELMKYMDPRNIIHAKKEAQELIQIADANKNGSLSLLEVIRCANKFVKSKFYNADKNLHSHE